jgi:hypothetical protein
LTDFFGNWLNWFSVAIELSLTQTDVLFDKLEILNVCNKSIFIFISIVENLFSSLSRDLNFQKMPSVVAECLEFSNRHFSVGTFGHFSSSMHDLKTHFGTMSLEKEVGLR